jgi:hypothetical protein
MEFFQLQPKLIQGLAVDQPALAQFEGTQFTTFQVLVDVVLADTELLGRLRGGIAEFVRHLILSWACFNS